MAAGSVIFMLAFALTFYVLGTTFVEGFVNYRTWHLIGADEFKPYHRAIKPGVLVFVVFPFALVVVLTGMLLWWLPSSILRWSVWLSLALDSFAVAVSVVFQIPIQLQMGCHCGCYAASIRSNGYAERPMSPIPFSFCG